MKCILLSLLVMYMNISIAQVTLDNVVSPQIGIGEDFYTVQISKSETKYLFSDTVSNTFSLYNMDFTPFLTGINVPVPFNHEYQVIYVTRELFDCDSTNIEYVYQSSINAFNTFYVVRTDGTILFRLDSANGPFCAGSCLGFSDFIEPIKNTSAGAKLFLQRPYSAYNGQIFIYSLCGTLTTKLSNQLPNSLKYVSVFPNPSPGTVNLRINLPDNFNKYTIKIHDSNSKVIATENINNNRNSTMEFTNLTSGMYYYSLINEIQTIQNGKFVITK